MAGLTPAHLLIILVIALIVIGPGKLPEVGAAIGKSFREFQKATGAVQDAVTGPLAGALPQAQTPQTQVQPPTQPYYTPQPGYPAPIYQAQPGYSAPVLPQPVSYQPVVGVVEPVPAQPAPTSYPPQNGTPS